MRDEEFEWHDDKAAQNLATHGISFEMARLAFDDAFAVERVDRRQRYDEDRFILLGMVQGRLLACCLHFTRQACRIISARESRERRRYHEENN